MNALFEIALANAVIASILAVAVWLITRIVRHPAIVQLLWVLVLAKLVTPPLVAVPWLTPAGNARAEAPQPPERALVAVPLVENSMATPGPLDPYEPSAAIRPAPTLTVSEAPRRGIPQVAAIDAPLPTQFPGHEAGMDELLEQPAAETPDLLPHRSPFPQISWRRLAIALWLFGSVLYSLIAAARLLRFQRALRNTAPANGELRTLADSVAQRLAYTRPFELRITSARLTPLVWPVGRPTLLLSQALIEILSSDELTTLLAHELAHLRRRDHWVRWLELAATVLYWWHPVVWFARREIARAEERACDAWVIGTYQSHDYASALFKTAEFISPPTDTAPLLASGLCSGGDLKERIEHVMNSTWKPTISLRMRCTLLIAALATLPLSLRAVAEEETTIEAEPPATSTDEKPVAAISNPAEEGEKTIEPGMSLIVEIVGEAREGESWDDLRGREVVREDGSIGLGPMAGRVKVAGKTLPQAAETILPHVQAIQQRPAKVQVSFATTESVLEPVSDPFQPSTQNPVVTTRSSREQEIERSLTTPVNVAYADSPLETVLGDLAEAARIDIYLDPVAFAQEGVSIDEPVTLTLKNEVSLKSALNLILEPFHLTFAIEDEVLKITSKRPSAAPFVAAAGKPRKTDGFIRPGDTVHIWVVFGGSLKSHLRGDFVVESAGTVALGPQYGRINIAGRTAGQAEIEIIRALKEHGLKEPKVQVTQSRSSLAPDTAQNYVASKPQSLTPKTGEELEILRSHVAFLEQQFRQTEARYRVGSPLGSADAYELAAQELAAAQAELALAEGRHEDAVAKMKESIEHGELALKNVQASYAAGRLSQDLLLRTAKSLADSKRALLHLQNPGPSGIGDSVYMELIHQSSKASSPAMNAEQLPVSLGQTDSLSVLKAIAERAKGHYERVKALAERGEITQSAVERFRADYEISQARLRQAEQVLKQRQLELRLAELEYETLRTANEKAPGSVTLLELEKLKLKVEFAKAKVAEIAE